MSDEGAAGGALPPMPDAHTGQPAPPSAPRDAAWEAEQPPSYRRWRVVGPPPHRGPVLAWYYGAWIRQVNLFVSSLGLALVFAVLIGLGVSLDDGSWEPIVWGVTSPWIWGAIGAWCLFGSARAHRERISAGSDWLMVGEEFVETYRLSFLECTIDGSSSDDKTVIMTDAAHREIRCDLRLLTINPWLWDLVCNGIRHSMAAGLRPGMTAISVLRLPVPTGS